LTLFAFLLAAGVGGVVGLASGLLGIGGGIVMVPFLYLLMAHGGWSGLEVLPEHHAAVAHATSLAVIFPTALSGLRAYQRQDLLDWNVILPLGIAAGISAVAGAWIAVALPSALLKGLFGVFLLAMGVRLLAGRAGGPVGAGEAGRGGARSRGWDRRPLAVLACGGLIGLLSAVLGVGGGIVAIPILIRWGRMDLHRVTAASIGIVVFAGAAGAGGYVWSGWGVDGLPRASLGLVSIPAALALLPGAVLMAPLGARLNQRLPVATLRRVFAALMLVVGGRLAWVHLAGMAAGS
jgi:uncharacterized protein